MSPGRQEKSSDDNTLGSLDMATTFSNQELASLCVYQKENLENVHHKANIKFPDPSLLQEAYQIRKGENLLKGGLA
jgi:hypothetical protein